MRMRLLLFLMAMPLFPQVASNNPSELTLEQKEEFLLKAEVKKTSGAKKGITGTVRATLSDGTITHDASIQSIDEAKQRFEGTRGIEMNFRDTYLFNIAAYRLGKILGLSSMIPPSVSRRHAGNSSAWTWWVDDVLMDEGDRLKQKTKGPDEDKWGKQTLIMRVWDQLIANTDRNVGNTIYDKNWNLWMIDHTRAFRLRDSLVDAKIMDMCDRQLLASMKALELETLNKELGPWLSKSEIKAIMKRRDLIVAYFEKTRPGKLFDYLPQR